MINTIDLKFNTIKNGKIAGEVEIKLFNMPINLNIVREFHCDTLLAAYTFNHGANDQITYKNLLAF